MPKNSAKRKPRKNTNKTHVDSTEWKLPPTPFETSFGILPFTIQGNFSAFDVNKENNYTLRYPGVAAALDSFVGGSNVSELSFRVTHVGFYGKTSTEETTSGNASQSIVTIYDAYSGRSVRGVSDYTRRARAGLELPFLKQMKWFNQGNRDVGIIPELSIAYFRKTGGNTCIDPSTEGSSYDLIVRGYVRFTRTPAAC